MFPFLLQVRARLEAKERAVVGRTERDIETLEKDLEELRRRDQEISQLLQSGDCAHFLQVSWRNCVCVCVGGRGGDWECSGGARRTRRRFRDVQRRKEGAAGRTDESLVEKQHLLFSHSGRREGSGGGRGEWWGLLSFIFHSALSFP